MSDRYDMDTAIMNDKYNEQAVTQANTIIDQAFQLAKAQAEIEWLKKGYTEKCFQAQPCPGCEYRAGVFIEACGLHEQIALLRREVDENTRDYRAVRNELAQAQAEIEQRKAELEGWKSRNVYPLEYREALEEIASLRTEINLWRESANSMKAAWNAACADIDPLRTKLAEAQAEKEKFRQHYLTACADREYFGRRNTSLLEKLAEAQAEVERLKALAITHHDERTITLYKTIEGLCAKLAEAREATASLICPQDSHTLGCQCACVVCLRRANWLAANRKE